MFHQQANPVMTAYKLVIFKFDKFGFTTLVESKVMSYEERLFAKFHRQVFVWIDKWYGLTLDDIRQIEDETKHSLERVKESAIKDICRFRLRQKICILIFSNGLSNKYVVIGYPTDGELVEIFVISKWNKPL